MKNKKTLFTPLLLVPIAAQAADCDNTATVSTTPTSDFEILGDGSSVLHEPTGLVWSRCSMGKTWTGSACSGDATDLNWQDALQEVADINASGGFADSDEWRMPSVNELETIVERCKINPAINDEIFDSQGGYFWTSTPSVASSNKLRAWQIQFSSGQVSSVGRESDDFYSNLVRVVRDHDAE